MHGESLSLRLNQARTTRVLLAGPFRAVPIRKLPDCDHHGREGARQSLCKHRLLVAYMITLTSPHAGARASGMQEAKSSPCYYTPGWWPPSLWQ